jgi:hypothetical protein
MSNYFKKLIAICIGWLGFLELLVFFFVTRAENIDFLLPEIFYAGKLTWQ